MEQISWVDPRSGYQHQVKEDTIKGHLFRWICSYTNEEGELVTLDYGLVPGGIFVAVEGLLESLVRV
jgi:hypothetical protein